MLSFTKETMSARFYRLHKMASANYSWQVRTVTAFNTLNMSRCLLTSVEAMKSTDDSLLDIYTLRFPSFNSYAPSPWGLPARPTDNKPVRRVHEGYESSAGGEMMCLVEEYRDWHELHAGLVTDDLLHRALNGSRHNGWLGLIRAVSSEKLFHFTSLQGATIKRDHRGFLGEPVSSRWSRMGEDNRDEEINCCLR